MDTTRNYHLGLLNLVHLLMNADGIIDDNEKRALIKLRELEQIPDLIFNEFNAGLATKKHREIYQEGINLMNQCTDEEKLRAFVHLYKMTEVDGYVHVKEVRLLLYSIKMAHVEFADVVALAAKTKSY